MRHIALITSLFCIIHSPSAFAQEAEYEGEPTFESKASDSPIKSTLWIPGRGVKLLNKKTALQVWRRVEKTQCPLANRNNGVLTSFNVFQTNNLNIFTIDTQNGIDWIICRRDTNEREFVGDSIAAGYAGDPKKPAGGGCSAGVMHTTARFRSYVKDGPLLLEVHVPGCREGESHNEFLFHLDKDTLLEVPGSRLLMNEYLNFKKSKHDWMWVPGKGGYTRYGKIEWTDKGEMKWTRTLAKLPLEATHRLNISLSDYDYKRAIYSRTCQYSKKLEIVECSEKLLSRGRLSADEFIKHGCPYLLDNPKDYYGHDSEIIKRAIQKMDHYRSIGYDIDEREVRKLKTLLKELNPYPK